MSFSTDEQHVTVRMYNVGFGDAFLLAFPGRERSARVLIDCGSHNASPRPRPVGEVVERIVEAVTDDDGVPRIDLVVGTHRHRDHVSGFEQDLWERVEVGEVWLPWTEHPTDPEARRVREAQSSAARRLHLALQQLGAEPGLLELVENSLTNERAMATLHRGFRGRPNRRFLAAPMDDPLELEALGTVRVHVLGPPRDAQIIRDMEPPAGESYFRLDDADEDGDGASPFSADWTIGPDELGSALEDLKLTPKEMSALRELGGLNRFSVAVQLEKAVNGTSLMLAFELGDAVLVFPGDAQWGTWRRVMEDDAAKALLARTSFYKVGHHGSHNATPKDFVEEVLRPRLRADEGPGTGLRAMVSTHPMARWKFIPKRELLDALRGLSEQVARSDETDGAVPGFTYESDLFIETRVPT
jgi:beta-lactamase superfamily II metal-dependent hydrolase